jgi:radical SAM-linked protein
MRVVALMVARASLPVRYTEGFNPHPRLSLACPRPVGMTSRDDVLVAVLDEPVEAGDILARLNAEAPEGMTFTRADPLDRTPQPVAMTCTLALAPARAGQVRARLDELAGLASWNVQRAKGGREPAAKDAARCVDIKPLVERMAVEDDTLVAALRPRDGRWARPAELLELLALDPRGDLARMERTKVEYDP